MNKIIAYKVFNPDFTCRNFKYKVGETYKLEENGKLISPIKCEKGFHACRKVSDCFNYYSFNPSNKVAIVELSGEVIEDSYKIVSNIITILEEISWEKMLTLANSGTGNSGIGNSGDWNSGDWNSGDWNSGNRNSGDWNSGDWNSGNGNSGNRNSGNRNSGDWNSGNGNSGNGNSGNRNPGNGNSGNRNSGDWNSGDWNSGDWNSGDWNSGFFNSNSPSEIRVFNKNISKKIWDNCIKPNFLYNIILNSWVSEDEMSDEEKVNNPNFYVTRGYLKTYSYKEAWKNAFEKASRKEIDLLKNLPNFNSEIFFEITGIKVN